MDQLSSCYFCGGALDASLSEYPVIPKSLHPDDDLQGTVVLCSTCRNKLAPIVESVVTAAQDAASDPLDQNGPSGEANGSDVESGPGAPDQSEPLDGPEPGSETASGVSVDESDSTAEPSLLGNKPAEETDSGISVDDTWEAPEADAGVSDSDRDGSEQSTAETTGSDSSPDDPQAWSFDHASPSDPRQSASSATDEESTGSDTDQGSTDSDTDQGSKGPDADQRSTGTDTDSPEERTASASGTESGAADEPDGDENPSLTKLEYSKVMRLLQNRDLPVNRAEIRDVAVNAYDIQPEQFDAIIDAAVRRDLIGQENGELVSPE